nr:variable surface lipoprotein [Mycoplasmopsis bovis]
MSISSMPLIAASCQNQESN